MVDGKATAGGALSRQPARSPHSLKLGQHDEREVGAEQHEEGDHGEPVRRQRWDGEGEGQIARLGVVRRAADHEEARGSDDEGQGVVSTKLDCQNEQAAAEERRRDGARKVAAGKQGVAGGAHSRSAPTMYSYTNRGPTASEMVRQPKTNQRARRKGSRTSSGAPLGPTIVVVVM